MMKKIFLVFSIILALLAMQASESQAAQSENVSITVTVAPSLSLSLSGSSIALGAVTTGSTTETSEAIIVENTGSGVAERFSLSHSTSGDWTSGTTPGAETFVLNAAFVDTVAGATWAHADSVISGNVVHGSREKLWFQFNAPTATSSTSEQTITITVNAQLP